MRCVVLVLAAPADALLSESMLLVDFEDYRCYAEVQIEINPYQHMTRESTPMTAANNSRRNFLKGAGASLIAAGAVAGFGLSASPAGAAQSCVTQSRDTQKAITAQMALQMLKDGNARFVQGRMLKCDYMQQVRATGDGQFPFAAIVGCIDSRASNELIFDRGIGDIVSVLAGRIVLQRFLEAHDGLLVVRSVLPAGDNGRFPSGD